MPKDFKLDPITHDLVIINNDFVLVDGIEELVQNLKIRLWFFLQEWFLDTSEGVPFYEDIFVKNPDLNAVSSIIKDRIMSTDGITEIKNFELEYNSSQRTCEVVFEVDTIYGKSQPINMEF